MCAKVSYNSLSDAEKKKFLGEFYSMVASLKSRDEAKRFFKDLLTLSEVVMISRRIQIAKMLLEGATDVDIKNKLKVGFATITQVNRWLENGFGGYKQVIRDFERKSGRQVGEGKDVSTPFSPAWVRRKYKAHSFLLNLLNKK